MSVAGSLHRALERGRALRGGVVQVFVKNPSAVWRRSVDALTDELERAELLGLAFVVLHPGSHLEARRAAAAAERLGLCLDTCHLFAASLDIRDAAVYESLIDAVGASVSLAGLLAFHLNDARASLGSGLGRHEHIGRG